VTDRNPARTPTDRAASIRARLLNLAKASGSDFNLVLVRFGLERFLFRLAASGHAQRFVLKGALLFTLWHDLPHRATRDADLLGFGPSDAQSLAATFQEVAGIPVDDGIVFDPLSIRVATIRDEARYGGLRVALTGTLSAARCVVQVDVGFGDAVTPGPVEAIYPTLLDDLPSARLRTYPVETVIAEKLHAIVVLGMVNSRLKDYLDLVVLTEPAALDERVLARAVAATFDRRGTPLPTSPPAGLTDEFAVDRSRVAMWDALLRRNGIAPRPLQDVVDTLRTRLWRAITVARSPT
jgi:hypothetical protein